MGVSDRLSGLVMGVQAEIAKLTNPAEEGLSYASAHNLAAAIRNLNILK